MADTEVLPDLAVKPTTTINISVVNVVSCIHRNSINGLPEQQINGSPSSGWRHFTLNQYVMLIILALGNVSCGACYSIIAPFFPKEAEKKRVSESEYGLVFGTFFLVMVVASPIWGKVVPIVTIKFSIVASIFWTGSCSILFGFLNQAPPGITFLALAIAVRCLEAFGTSGYWTATYTLLAGEFPDQMSSVMAVVESFFGLGMIIGPVFGGFLYELGGYPLPFHSLGGFLLLICLLMYFLLKGADAVESQQSESYVKLFMNPGFLIKIGALTVIFMCLGFNEGTLSQHLDQFHMSPSAVGATFIACGGIYALSSPAYGFIADRVKYPELLCISGTFLCSLGFLIIGPVPFIPIKSQSFWSVILAQVFIGIGVGTNVVFMVILFRDAIKRGFPDREGTFSLVSGSAASISSVGGFAGPSLGGFLVDHIGYRNGSLVMFLLSTAMGVILTLNLLWEFRLAKRLSRSEASALLTDS